MSSHASMFRIAIAVACALAAGSMSRAAAADADAPPQLLISPLTGSFAGSLDGLPAALTAELERSVRDRGITVEIAGTPFSDTAAIVGCDPASADCLDRVASTLNVAKLLYGHVEAGDAPDAVVVSLVLFTRGEPLVEREYELTGADTDTLVAALSAALAGMDYDQTPELAETPAIVLGPRAGVDGVEPWAWGLLGGGAGAVATGGFLLLLADQRQGEIDSAPTESAEDFRRLADLEAGGRTRARWGVGLLVVGGAVAVAGAVYTIRQARARRPAPALSDPELAPEPAPAGAGDDTEPAPGAYLAPPPTPAVTVRLAPLPLPGGMGVALTFEGLP